MRAIRPGRSVTLDRNDPAAAEEMQRLQTVYNVPIDMQMEIESPSSDQAVETARRLRQQLPGLLKDLLMRFQIIGTELTILEDSVHEIVQPDIRFRLFGLNAHMKLSVQEDNLTMVAELVADFCEEIDIRLGPTFTQLKIKKDVMDILYDKIALRTETAQ